MRLDNTIRKLATRLRVKVATEIRRLEEQIRLNPSDKSAIHNYVRELIRNSGRINPRINTVLIAKEYLAQKYNSRKGVKTKNGNLISVRIDGVDIPEISWLEGLDLNHLEELSLFTIQTNNLSFLDGVTLPRLTTIRLVEMPIDSLPILKTKSLLSCTIRFSNLSNISPISQWECPTLRSLTLRNNKIESLDSMKDWKLPQVRIIDFNDNPVGPIGITPEEVVDYVRKWKQSIPAIERVLLPEEAIRNIDLQQLRGAFETSRVYNSICPTPGNYD